MIMSNKGKNPKRKTRIPNRLKDTMCDLNNKKECNVEIAIGEENSESRVSSVENGVIDELDVRRDAGENSGMNAVVLLVLLVRRRNVIWNLHLMWIYKLLSAL